MEIESVFARAFSSLDALLAPLLAGRWWFLRVGALAITLSLVFHSPSRPIGYHWALQVLQQQVDHPLTPLQPWKYNPRVSPVDDGIASHLDKLTFRLTIPILGKIFHTGVRSWLIFSGLAGVVFYPLFAVLCERWLKNRQTVLYLTAAFAISWTGRQFFDDYGLGDGVAWFFLLLSVASRRPLFIFFSVLAAAFTDERGLIASAGTFLFWAMGDENVQTGKAEVSTAVWSRWKQKGAVAAAWLVYLGMRYYLGSKFGLKTGNSMMWNPQVVVYNLQNSIPYSALAVFEGLWPWLLFGFVSLLVDRRYLAAGGYAGIYLLLGAIALVVWDFQRTLAYSLVLFPLAWRARGLQPQNALFVSRLVFLLGLALVTPWETPLRYLRFLR